MNRKQIAAEAIEREISRLEGLRMAAEEFKRIGDVEQHEAELRSVIGNHERKIEELHKEEARLTACADAEIERAKQVKSEGEKTASAKILEAKVEAKGILDSANAVAEKILFDTEKRKAEIEKEIAKTKERNTAILDDIAMNQERLKRLKEEIAALAKKWS